MCSFSGKQFFPPVARAKEKKKKHALESFLELDGDIPPILVSLVHKEKDSLHMVRHAHCLE